MNRFKQMIYLIGTCLIFSLLTACGGSKNQTVTLTNEQEGVTYQLESKDNILQKITQITNIDSSAGAEAFQTSINQYTSIYESIEGVTYSTEVVDTILVETITIDATNPDTIRLLSEQGLLTLDSESSMISLEKTIENLTAQGWIMKED